MGIRIRYICVVLLGAFLLSCADPIPLASDKLEYVGLWVASDRYISIFANGRLEFKEKLSLGMHNRTESNFRFVGNTIESAMFTSFVVDRPPYKDNGKWKMQVDGIRYVRSGRPMTYGRSNNWPEGIRQVIFSTWHRKL